MNMRVLVVDDDIAVREAIAQTLELADIAAIKAGSFIEAKDHIAHGFDGVVLSDIRMPGRDGFHLLNHAQAVDSELPVILLTGEGDIPMAVQAMGQGAFDFLEKPCASETLLAVLTRAMATRALVLENRALKAQLETGDAAARMLFGTSLQAESLRRQVRLVARAGREILVTGPAGSGVSKVAEVIHLMSPGGKGPFGKHAAAGLTPQALHRVLVDARGGTLFLNEIADLPQETQFALLERLEASDAPLFIAGGTGDADKAVSGGRLQADLFYRLEAMSVRIPSLAERPEDIPVLFRHYVAQASEQSGIEAPEITPDVLAPLMARDWPGNARALMSVAMRFVLGLSDGDGAGRASGGGLGLMDQMAQVERSLLADALRRTGGRASAAAQALKLPRKTFYDKLAKHGLKPETFR